MTTNVTTAGRCIYDVLNSKCTYPVVESILMICLYWFLGIMFVVVVIPSVIAIIICCCCMAKKRMIVN